MRSGESGGGGAVACYRYARIYMTVLKRLASALYVVVLIFFLAILPGVARGEKADRGILGVSGKILGAKLDNPLKGMKHMLAEMRAQKKKGGRYHLGLLTRLKQHGGKKGQNLHMGNTNPGEYLMDYARRKGQGRKA